MFAPLNISLPSSLIPRFLSPKHHLGIDIPAVKVHEIDSLPEKPARALKHLLKLNHVNHAILFNHREFHNHMPHILSSAYLMGADASHLEHVYEEESKMLVPWEDSPSEISKDDWRDYLGKRDYERAFVDFFEDELVHHGYDWRAVTNEYLFSGKEPLFNCLISGLGHPLIHLGYAFEMSNSEIAMEALGLAATNYNYLHKYLEDPSYSERQPPFKSSSPLVILERIRKDERLKDAEGDLDDVFKNHEEALLEHWNAWDITDPIQQLQQSDQDVTALFTATGRDKYDFFLVHLLTTSHAVRILIPFIPGEYHVPLLRQWWLIVVAIYISRARPDINLDLIRDHDLKGRDWKWAEKKAVEGKYSTDAHYVKPIRAMKEFATVWGDPEEYYLKAAVKFAEEFDGWGF